MSTLFVRAGGVLCILSLAGYSAAISHHVQAVGKAPAEPDKLKSDSLPPGTARIWQDRGALTPAKVYWGAASLVADPLSRLPVPPYTHFELDVTAQATMPKAKVTDSKQVRWTAKFGEENHSDTVAPRLAWALGFGAVEGYYVQSGKIEGIDPKTKLGILKEVINPDGSFSGGARFKRHDKDNEPVKDAKGKDITWDERQNPGVPPEQLSGLLIFEVMVQNWDAQPKNCKIYHTTGPNGPENWYIVSDLGASFGGGIKHKFDVAGYTKDPSFIKQVSGGTVELKFDDVIHSQAQVHQKIPLAHAQWFRKQLAKLTDDEIRAAFDAGFATDGLNRAYASGDAAQIDTARQKELPSQTRADIAAFVAGFRARITEFLQKVPAGS